MKTRVAQLLALNALHAAIDTALDEGSTAFNTRQATYTSAFLSDIRGKLNGSVFSRARGGIGTIRGLVRPRNPRSTQQLTVRAAVTALSAYWAATLTAAQRTAWNLLETETKSGFDQFIASNTLQLQGGNAIEPAAPATLNLAWTDIPVAADFVFEDDAGSLSIKTAVNMSTLLAAGKFLVYVQRTKQRPGWANRSSNLVFVGAVATAAALMDLAIPADIADGINPIGVEDTIYVKVRGINDAGQFTGEIEMRLPVTEV